MSCPEREEKPKCSNELNILLIKWDEEDEIYIAEIPVWPGCITHSVNFEDLWERLYYAMAAWKEASDKRNLSYDLRPLCFMDKLYFIEFK